MTGVLPPRVRSAVVFVLTLINTSLAFAISEYVARVVSPAPPGPRGAPMSERLALSGRTEIETLVGANVFGMLKPSPDRDLVYELKPSRHWLFQGVPIETNADGCRGREWPEETAAGVARVLVIGDSVAFGWGVATEDTWASVLERQLATQERPVWVLNCGVPGYNAQQEAALANARAPRLRPDVVVVGYTLNDEQRADFTDPARLTRLMSWSRLYQLGEDWCDRRFVGPARVRRAFARLRDAARRDGFRVVLFVYPQKLPGVDVGLPRSQAEANGFRYVDMFGPFEAYYARRGLRGLEDLYVHPDDPHPSTEGHELIASVLRPVVADVLRAPSSRP